VKRGSAASYAPLDHVPGSAEAKITSVSVEIRVGAGERKALPVKQLDGNRSRATTDLSSLAAGAQADLRATGKDAAGGRVVQTVEKAFTVVAG